MCQTDGIRKLGYFDWWVMSDKWRKLSSHFFYPNKPLSSQFEKRRGEKMNQVLDYTNSLKSFYPNQVSHNYYCIWVQNKLLTCFVFSKPGSTGERMKVKASESVYLFYGTTCFFFFMKPSLHILFFNLCLGFFMKNNLCNFKKSRVSTYKL